MGAGLQRASHLATLTRYLDTPYPVEGQTWQDCDKRRRGERTVFVVRVGEFNGILKARVLVFEKGLYTGRMTTIAVKRFIPNSTGYRFLKAANNAAKEGE